MATRLAREGDLLWFTVPAVASRGLMQLQGRLKSGDLVVCILHDHGSRYVGKVYNDQWMIERGFLDVRTFRT